MSGPGQSKGWIRMIEESRNSNRVLVALMYLLLECRVRIWDAVAFVEGSATLVGHTDLVHSVSWPATDGHNKTLFSGSQVWDFRLLLYSAAFGDIQKAAAAFSVVSLSNFQRHPCHCRSE